MKDATSFRKLVELVFSKEFEITEEMTATDSSIPACLLTDDFPQRWQDVLRMKQIIFHPEWEYHLNSFCNKMFSSNGMYLKCVIFACLKETTYYEYEFDIFLAVCAVLKYFNKRILNTTGVDFRDLYTEVAMVVYDNLTKSYVRERGGFQQLVEYIRGHRYLSLKIKVASKSPDAVRDAILKNRKVKKELDRRDTCKTERELEMIEARSIILTRKILDSTSFELPTLLTDPDLIKGLKASGSEEKEEKNEKEKIMKATTEFLDSDITSQGCSSSNSDSRRDHTINLPENMPLLGKPIEAVRAHYRARFSGNANLDNRIQKADGSM